MSTLAQAAPDGLGWAAAALTAALLVGYEVALAWMARRQPQRLARTAHAALREAWFDAVSAHKGSEILAVQALRNALMSATMTASTAALGLMGAATLIVPSLHAGPGQAAATTSLALTLELVLMGLLFASLVSSVMAVRYYNHAGYVVAMPVECAARSRFGEAGRRYVRRAGTLYSWGLRQLTFVAPVVVSLVHPVAGTVVAAALVLVLFGMDRVTLQPAT